MRLLFSCTAITLIPCSKAANVGSPKHPSGITRHEISEAVKTPGRMKFDLVAYLARPEEASPE